jgi:uncharacterized protein DUF397
VATDLSHAQFRKSRRSASGENCVEVAGNLPGVVAVRDSKDLDGRALTFTPGEWRSFTARVRGDDAEM